MSEFRELIVWQKSMDLVDRVYDFTSSFPQAERFGLWSQMTRAAISIPSNIAEGSGRTSAKDCVHFLSIARGSLYEPMTQMEIAERRHYGKINAVSPCVICQLPTTNYHLPSTNYNLNHG